MISSAPLTEAELRRILCDEAARVAHETLRTMLIEPQKKADA